MGVDVELYAVGPVSDDELGAANAYMADRVFPRGDYEEEHGYGRLVRSKVYGENWILGGPEQSVEDTVEFTTLSRYYGPGYERGDWPYIHNAIVCLRAALPQCKVFYGGDSGFAVEVTDEMLDEYWAHWLGPDGRAYFNRTSPLTGGNDGKDS